MAKKPTYKQLEERVKELEKELRYRKRVDDERLPALERTVDAIIGMIDGFTIADLDGTIRQVNRQFERGLGWKREEAIGKTPMELGIISEQEGQRIEKEIIPELIKEGFIRNIEIIVTRRDGTKFPASFSWTLMKDAEGKPTGISAVGRDITELKRAEEALREKEEHYRSLVGISPDAVFTISAKHRTITSLNPAFEKITRWTDVEWLGKLFTSIVHTKDRPMAEEKFEQALRGETTTPFELRILSKSGQYLIGEFVAAPQIRKGKVVGVFGFAHDISGRVQAEQALRASKELFEKTFISQKDAIFILSAEGPPKVIDCNPAATEIFGYTRQEMLGRRTTFLHVDEESLRDFQNQVHPAVAEQGYAHLSSFRMRRKDGIVFPTEHSLMPLKDDGGERIGWVSVVRDSSEVKSAKEALQESERKYGLLLETMNEGFSMVDKNGVTTYANRRLCEMLRYESDEIVGLSATRHFDGTNKKIWKEQLRRIQKGKSGPYEIAWTTQEGKKIPTIVSPRPIFDENGNFMGLFSVITDVSELKQTEQALREREKQLEIKTQSLEEVNIALRVLLRQRDEDKKELEEKVLFNVTELVVPYLEKLNSSRLDERQMSYLNVLESNLNEIISPFSRNLSSKYSGLTPTEIQVANHVRQGKTTKEIAHLLNLSSKTIDDHRRNIRKKLGIKKKQINLRTHLLSVQ